MLVATYYSGLYKATLVAHLLCAIFGFGAVVLNGLYGAEIKRRRGVEALAIAEANHKVSTVGEYFIYGVFVFGVLMIAQAENSQGVRIYSFSDTWVWLAATIYLVAIAVSHAVLFPAVKRMLVLIREMVAAGPPPAGAVAAGPPPQAAEMARLGKRLGVTGASLDLALVVVVVLMVWKPS